MKRILYIAVSSSTGGVPKHILEALKYNHESQEYGIAVAVPNDGDYYAWFNELACEMINLSLKPYDFRSLWVLIKYIKRNKISLIHSHGKGAGMYSRPLKLFCPGIRVVHTFHGIYLEQYSTMVRWIYQTIERFLKFFTDATICVSNSEVEEAEKLRFALLCKTFVIPNGVNPSLFKADGQERKRYVIEFGLSENAFIIGCVARLEKMKGHKYLLEAFKDFVKANPNSHLILVGDGPEHDEVEKIINNMGLNRYVTMAGFRHDISDILRCFDLFLSASLREGMPFTLLEALAAELPVIATDVIGNRDIVQDHYNGLLVKDRDAKDMYEKMKYACNNPEMCKQWGQKGMETVMEHFTIKQSMDKLFSIYNRLLK